MHPTRRAALAAAPAILAATAAASAKTARPPFRFCLNTSTIRGQKVPLTDEIDLAAKVGYDAIEPWINELEQYAASGGSLTDLGKRIRDRGLKVESAIGFAAWIVDDPTQRAKGLEDAKRAMGMVRQLGGSRLAAPPVGATDRSDINLLAAAERYRALLEAGDEIGVVPQVEVWGFSKTLSRLGEASLIAAESGHPKACVLADIYHLHKGGSGFDGLRLLSGAAIQVLHVNDYPAEPPRAMITDAHRVYPGDGVAPLKAVLNGLRAAGVRCVLSLELFNRDYWKLDPLEVARTGLAKMKAVAEA